MMGCTHLTCRGDSMSRYSRVRLFRGPPACSGVSLGKTHPTLPLARVPSRSQGIYLGRLCCPLVHPWEALAGSCWRPCCDGLQLGLTLRLIFFFCNDPKTGQEDWHPRNQNQKHCSPVRKWASRTCTVLKLRQLLRPKL